MSASDSSDAGALQPRSRLEPLLARRLLVALAPGARPSSSSGTRRPARLLRECPSARSSRRGSGRRRRTCLSGRRRRPRRRCGRPPGRGSGRPAR
eukprot:3034802-Pyramimonas_sp.AAC.1